MNSGSDDLHDKFYRIVFQDFKSQYGKRENLEYLLNYWFNSVSFQNKKVIDIGGGSGLCSLYAAIKGAKQVVCLEPELGGSDKSRHHHFNRMAEQLSLNNILRKPDLIQKFDPGNQKFDIILMMQSAHHFNEEASAKLDSSQDAREIYLSIFRKIEQMSAPGADLILVDRSKFDFYKLIGVNNPFCKCKNWDVNPSQQMWIALLQEVGFGATKIRWRPYKKFGLIGEKFLANRFFNYFLKNSFVINMKRVGPYERGKNKTSHFAPHLHDGNL